MNYLKSITSTVLNSTGVSFPFTIGERIPGITSETSIWDVREGVKKDDGTPLTLFIFDGTLPPLQPGNKDRRALMQLARNTLKKLKTIRHPDVIKYLDSVETETHVYIATERVRPLEGVLREWQTGGAYANAKGKGKEHWIGWGIRSIATALAFLNAAPLSLHHAYLLTSSIYITPAMEWRLGGFELLTARDDSAGVLWGLAGLAPGNVGEVSGPEVRKGGWTVLRDTDPAQSDTYLLALLIFTLYNPTSPLPNLSAQPTPSSAGLIPKSLFALWKRMLSPNPRARLTTTSFIAEAHSASFWSGNPLVALVEALDGFELRSEGEKLAVLRTIKDAAAQGELPTAFMMYKILPMLLHSISLPTAPSGAMLPLVLELGKNVPQGEYGKMILDPVVRLYQSPDRGTRMALLDGLPEYADKMDQRTVSDKVWPHLITGFADTVPVIREATVKAVFPLSTKLTDRILNNDLLRLLAKMQTDTEPSIRTNTCILIGRLAPNLGTNTKKKVLVPAFARSLRDPFVHARVAGLMALMATVEIFDRDDLAGKVIPNMAFTMVDKEKLVRDQAFKAMGMFMQRVENFAAAMPDTVLSEQQQSQSYGPVTTTSQTNAAGQAGLVNSAAGAAGALAGWAITSLSKQLATTEIHSSMSSAPASSSHVQGQSQSQGGMSGYAHSSSGAGLVPGAFNTGSSTGGSPRGSTDSWVSAPTQGGSRPGTAPKVGASGTVPGFGATKASNLALGRTGGGGGMKLGGTANKAGGVKGKTANTALEEVMGDWDDEGVENAWGTDDLIDVNADEDDWAAFESAPVPEIVAPPAQSYYVKPPTTTPRPVPPTNGSTSKPGSSIPAPKTPSTAASPARAPVPTLAPAIPPASTSTSASAAASPRVSESIPRSSTASPALSAGSGTAASATPAAPAGGLAGMSKDEKEAEMARRREERKARIAAMKKGKS